MTISRFFFVFAAFAGLATGVALVEFPAVREAKVPAYFLILIALAAFDVVCVIRGRGVITMATRIAGFAIAIAAMVLVPLVAGVEVRFF